MHGLADEIKMWCNETGVRDLYFWLYCKTNMDFNVRLV
jgi:hypothetical protein